MNRDDGEKKNSMEKILCAEYPINGCFLAAIGKIRYFFSLLLLSLRQKASKKGNNASTFNVSYNFFSLVLLPSFCHFRLFRTHNFSPHCVATLPVPRLRSLFLVTGWWRWVCDSSRNALNQAHTIPFRSGINYFFPYYIGIEKRVFEHVYQCARTIGLGRRQWQREKLNEQTNEWVRPLSAITFTAEERWEKNNCVRDSDENVPQK